MKDTANRISTFKDSVFGIISARARKNNAINLGQGSPDFDGAEWIKKYVSESMDKGQNQYAPFMGIPHLRESIAKLYKNKYNLEDCLSRVSKDDYQGIQTCINDN